MWGRKGKVWSDRFFARALRTPREVYNALRYLFGNARKHGMKVATLAPDWFTSGPWFEGWADFDRRFDHYSGRIARPTARARSWLLRVGWWKHHGLLPIP